MTRGRVALVVRGGWDGHHPVEATELFVPFLEERGFAVRVEESPEAYAGPALDDVDLVVQCVTQSQLSGEAFGALSGAVARGTGLAGWHGGIADSYRSHSGYLQLVGGQFAAHPARAPREELRGDETDSFRTYTVSVVPEAADHPIVRGVPDFELTTEQYWVLSDGLNDVLATTTLAARDFDPWHRPVTCPAVWTRGWGDGRVFVCTPGHDLDVLRNHHVRTVVERGLLWASR